MISRRKFLHTAACVSSGATVTLLFTSLGTSTGCSSDDDTDDNTQTGSTNPTEPAPAPAPAPAPTPTPTPTPTPAPSGGCDNQGGIGSTSSVSLGHTHGVCVAGSDLTNPPESATYETTNADGHTHAVTLSAALLRSLDLGETVVTDSTNVAGHTHAFAIRRA